MDKTLFLLPNVLFKVVSVITVPAVVPDPYVSSALAAVIIVRIVFLVVGTQQQTLNLKPSFFFSPYQIGFKGSH